MQNKKTVEEMAEAVCSILMVESNLPVDRVVDIKEMIIAGYRSQPTGWVRVSEQTYLIPTDLYFIKIGSVDELALKVVWSGKSIMKQAKEKPEMKFFYLSEPLPNPVPDPTTLDCNCKQLWEQSPIVFLLSNALRLSTDKITVLRDELSKRLPKQPTGWVRASERLPKQNGPAPWRLVGTDIGGNKFTHGGFICGWTAYNNYDSIEWYEEGPGQSVPAPAIGWVRVEKESDLPDKRLPFRYKWEEREIWKYAEFDSTYAKQMLQLDAILEYLSEPGELPGVVREPVRK